MADFTIIFCELMVRAQTMLAQSRGGD